MITVKVLSKIEVVLLDSYDYVTRHATQQELDDEYETFRGWYKRYKYTTLRVIEVGFLGSSTVAFLLIFDGLLIIGFNTAVINYLL